MNDTISLMKTVQEIKPDYVFHLAAQKYPDQLYSARVDTLNTNILGTCRLLEALQAARESDASYRPVIRNVCASSEVFGKIPADKKPEAGIHEECPFHPGISLCHIQSRNQTFWDEYYAQAYMA